jgi:hypothetical protein
LVLPQEARQQGAAQADGIDVPGGEFHGGPGREGDTDR